MQLNIAHEAVLLSGLVLIMLLKYSKIAMPDMLINTMED